MILHALYFKKKYLLYIKSHMMRKIVLILIIIISNFSYSQTKSVQLSLPNPSEIIYTVDQVVTAPQFKGGKKALETYVKRNFNVSVTKKGEILVSFIVEKDGSLSEIGVLNDAGIATADEAVRIMSISPKWKPGILNGNTVRVQYLYTMIVGVN